MHGKKRKQEWIPESLVKHIERELGEINRQHPTRVEAMERIARKLDELVIKKKRRMRI